MFRFAIAVILLSLLPSLIAEDEAEIDVPSKLDRYEEIDFQVLRLAPEDHKFDHVWFEERFLGTVTQFPEYIHKSGFKETRYFILNIGHASVPVVVRKKDEWVELVASMRKGAFVRVYGEIKKFRHSPEVKIFPNYYFDMAYMVVIDNKPPGDWWLKRGKNDPRLNPDKKRPRKHRERDPDDPFK